MNHIINRESNRQIVVNPLLLVTFIVLLTITGCGDNTTAPEDTPSIITEDKAVTAIMGVMQDRGLVFPFKNISVKGNFITSANSLSKNDYLAVDLDEEGERRVHFDIGPDGHIIPKGEWRDANPDYCKDQNRFMKAAVKRLQFKMFAAADGYYVFVQYIDVATGKIENQREGEADTLKEAINKAWDKLEVNIKSPTDPCDDLKGITLYFNSRIQEEYDDVTIMEHVEAEIVLEANEEGIYKGSGPIKYIEITTSVDGNCTFPDGTLNIHELILKMEEGIPTEETALDMEYENTIVGGSCTDSDGEYVTTWPFNYVGMHMDEWYSEDGESWDGLIIRDWEAVPDDDSVLARKVYDRTETVDNGGGFSTTTENTTIEIRE